MKTRWEQWKERWHLPQTLWLTAVWVVLWGDLSVGNVVAGFLVSGAVVVAFPLPRLDIDLRLRPWPTAILVSRFFWDMAKAALHVAWLTVRPGPPPRGLVVDMHLKGRNQLFQTITAEMVALVPGTLVIDLDSDSGTLVIHVIDISTRAEAALIRRKVLAQEARLLRAVHPDPDSVLDPRRRRELEQASEVHDG